jgi:hypothetical protein
MKLKLTFWERSQLYDLLSAQNISRAPLGEVHDMMEARAKIDPTELDKPENDKSYELTFKDSQIRRIYSIATNENIPWPISEQSANLYEKLEDAKTKLNGKSND